MLNNKAAVSTSAVSNEATGRHAYKYYDPTDVLGKLPAYGFWRVGEGGDVRVFQGTPPPVTIGGGIKRSTPAEGSRFAQFLACQQEVAIANAERQAAADNAGGNEHHQV